MTNDQASEELNRYFEIPGVSEAVPTTMTGTAPIQATSATTPTVEAVPGSDALNAKLLRRGAEIIELRSYLANNEAA